MHRIIMPLFQFKYLDHDEYTFSDTRFSIREFDASRDVPDYDIFSRLDRQYMEMEQWALVAEANDLSGYKEDGSLLLMAFRLLSNGLSPIIKYRITNDLATCSILREILSHNMTPIRYHLYRESDFLAVDNAYLILLAADKVSIRTSNALYFLYVAFHADRWIEAFLTLMMSLEGLFSKDSHGRATATICHRVTNFVSDAAICTGDIMRDLYDTRSRMAHGNLPANKSEENLAKLKRLENITVACFRKLIDGDLFKSYATKLERDRFVSQWD